MVGRHGDPELHVTVGQRCETGLGDDLSVTVRVDEFGEEALAALRGDIDPTLEKMLSRWSAGEEAFEQIGRRE